MNVEIEIFNQKYAQLAHWTGVFFRCLDRTTGFSWFISTNIFHTFVHFEDFHLIFVLNKNLLLFWKESIFSSHYSFSIDWEEAPTITIIKSWKLWATETCSLFRIAINSLKKLKHIHFDWNGCYIMLNVQILCNPFKKMWNCESWWIYGSVWHISNLFSLFSLNSIKTYDFNVYLFVPSLSLYFIASSNRILFSLNSNLSTFFDLFLETNRSSLQYNWKILLRLLLNFFTLQF